MCNEKVTIQQLNGLKKRVKSIAQTVYRNSCYSTCKQISKAEIQLPFHGYVPVSLVVTSPYMNENSRYALRSSVCGGCSFNSIRVRNCCRDAKSSSIRQKGMQSVKYMNNSRLTF